MHALKKVRGPPSIEINAPKVMSICLTPRRYSSRQLLSCFSYWTLHIGPRRSASSNRLPRSNEDVFGILQDIRKDLEASDLADQTNASPDHEDPRIPEEVFCLEQMPLSPLIDKDLIKARRRYQEPKPLPSKERTAFQSVIEKNPYAQMLSTPLRRCVVTGIRLPSYFQLPFTILAHPRTGDPWLISPSLEPTTRENLRSNQDFEHLPLDPESLPNHQAPLSDPSPPPPSPPTNSSQPPNTVRQPFPNAIYISSHRLALTHINSFRARGIIKLLPFRWRTNPQSAVDLKSTIWRKDMDVLVLDLMRKRVVHLLRYLGHEKRKGYVESCEGYDSIGKHNQIRAVLWMGKRDSGQESMARGLLPDEETGDSEASNLPPPPYALVKYRARQIPIFNLLALLGEEHLKSVSALGGPFVGQLAVIKNKRNATSLVLWLWKLMGYMGESLIHASSMSLQQPKAHGVDQPE